MFTNKIISFVVLPSRDPELYMDDWDAKRALERGERTAGANRFSYLNEQLAEYP